MNHAGSELSACFDTRCLSVHFAHVHHQRYETMETPWNLTEKAARVSRFWRTVTKPFFVNEQRTAMLSRNEQPCLNHVCGSRPKHVQRNLSIEVGLSCLNFAFFFGGGGVFCFFFSGVCRWLDMPWSYSLLSGSGVARHSKTQCPNFSSEETSSGRTKLLQWSKPCCWFCLNPWPMTADALF